MARPGQFPVLRWFKREFDNLPQEIRDCFTTYVSPHKQISEDERKEIIGTLIAYAARHRKVKRDAIIGGYQEDLELIVNLPEDDSILQKHGIDSTERHQKFIEKYDLPFTLIADTDKKVVQKYRVWQEKKLYGKTYMGIVRTTFIIDKTGTIRKIFPKVKVKTHIDEVLAVLKEI